MIFNLSDLNGRNGFIINGVNKDDYTGTSISRAGDINGDGFDDIIIGESENAISGYGGPNRPGKSYVIFGSADRFNTNFDLSTLDGRNGFVLEGEIAASPIGINVSDAGDINGDGLDDFLIGSPYADLPPGPYADASGQTHVVFGTTEGFNASVNLSSLDGRNGFTINGVGDFDFLGSSVSGAGDINGDGLDDLIVGSLQANRSYERKLLPEGFNTRRYSGGESYVIFGSTEGFNADLSVRDLDGKNGFIIGTENQDLLDAEVSSGDINGDGLDDIFIGAPASDKVYVVFGSSEDFGPNFNIDNLDGRNGFIIDIAPSSFDRFFDGSNTFISSAGDFNGDGIGDLVIGSPSSRRNAYDIGGHTYVIFGTTGNFEAHFSLTDLNGSNGFAIIDDSDVSFSNLGTSVSSAGDINGDGFDDIVIGSPTGTGPDFGYGRVPGSEPGEIYVLFGRREGLDASLSVTDIDGNNGFIIRGIDNGDGAGEAVSRAGDINGDGIDDLLVSAPFAGPLVTRTTRYDRNTEFTFTYSDGRGESYVIFGNAAPELDLNDSEPGSDFKAIFDGSSAVILSQGLTVSDRADTIASATISIANVMDGAAESLTAQTEGTNISAIYDADLGSLKLDGEDTVENYQKILQTVAYNNSSDNPNTEDRTIEFVVDDGAGFSNTSHVAITTVSVQLLNPIDGTDNRDILTGTSAGDLIQGLAGNDFLTGRAGDDSLDGGNGSDAIFGGRGEDSLSGEQGNDVLSGGRGDDQLSAGAGRDTLFGSQGDDWLSGGADDDILSGGQGNDTLQGGSGDDTLFGGAGNDEVLVSDFSGIDTFNGGTGTDILRLEPTDGRNLTLFIGQGAVGDRRGGGQFFVNFEQFVTGDGNDRLLGDGADNFLNGGDGDDTLVGGRGSDTLLGGNDASNNGADTFKFERDLLDGRADVDVIEGFGVEDVLDFSDYLNAGGILGFTRISSEQLLVNLSNEDMLNIEGSAAGLDVAERQLTIT